jgi:hypothetical protein
MCCLKGSKPVNIKPQEVQGFVDHCIAQLHSNFLKGDLCPAAKKVVQNLRQDGDKLIWKATITNSRRLRNGEKRVVERVVEVIVSGTLDDKDIKSKMSNFASLCIDQLKDRFKDAKLLTSFAILDPKSYVGMSKDTRSEYGYQSLIDLYDFFFKSSDDNLVTMYLAYWESIKDTAIAESLMDPEQLHKLPR